MGLLKNKQVSCSKVKQFMSQEATNFAELFQNSEAYHQMSSGDVVKGKVVDISKDYVIVDVGLKSEGLIPTSQFLDHEGDLTVDVGDEVDVMIEMTEDGYGNTRLSREKARRAAAWEHLEKQHNKGETVIGIITSKVKGGFTVEVEGVRAFLPGSLVDVRPVRDPSYLEGKELEFKVIKMDRKRSNVVVSRRAVVEEEMASERENLLETLEEEQELTGIVKNLTDYGAFIDLGGVDGLLHITDMSWKRIKHPSELVNIGDEVQVKVLKFDRDKSRVSLGMKQLGSDPWVDLVERYPSGSILEGEVTNITDYGCFVEIENGIEGLVHMSEMDWTNKNIHPNKVVSLGDFVNVMILEIDEERRRISLGMKQCQPNPWEAFAENHQEGEVIRGSIKSITDFGIFIGLDGGIDGLIHLSDVSKDKSGEEAVREYKKEQEIDAMILSIDPERERIALGIKQLHMDPKDVYLENHTQGSQVQGEVTELDDEGNATVKLAENVYGILSSDEMETPVEVGQQIQVRLVDIDKDDKTIGLSTKPASKRVSNVASKKLSTEDNSQQAKTSTLGDLLKEKLADKDKDQ